MLKLVEKYMVFLYEDEEAGLAFTWNGCCPYVYVSYIESCEGATIDTIDTGVDPILYPEGDPAIEASIKGHIINYIKEKTPS